MSVGAVPRQRPFKSLISGSPNLIVTSPGNYSTTVLEWSIFTELYLIHSLTENMLRVTITLYMEDPSLPLPTQEEVLICTPETTEEEVCNFQQLWCLRVVTGLLSSQVTLLWRRAINDPNHKRIFCLVHPEKLQFQVSDRALRTLSELSQGKRGKIYLACMREYL